MSLYFRFKNSTSSCEFFSCFVSVSTVQMPGGMPVGTVAIGKAGAVNAAYLALQILALNDQNLDEMLKADRAAKAKQVEEDSAKVEVLLA